MHKSNIEIQYSCKSNEWETPPKLFNILNEEFCFDLDAAATEENALCKAFFTEKENSLIQDWSIYKTIFCNPPYGNLLKEFVKKGFESRFQSTVVFLIPARTETKWWHDFCAMGEVRFIKPRLKFKNKLVEKISPAPFPSAIVIFSSNTKPITKYFDLNDY